MSGRPNLVSAPGSESKSQSQSKSLREPERARECEREPERARKSQREPGSQERARESQREPEKVLSLSLTTVKSSPANLQDDHYQL